MVILIIIFILFLLFIKYCSSFNNPYKLIMIFGKKGSGKTTFLTKQALKHNLQGWHVFSNTEIFNTYRLNTDDIGIKDFPEKSLLLIDEVGMVWDNRNFKSFPVHVRDFFKLQRHKKIKVILASQAFDVDKKLRDLTDEMYLLKSFCNVFTICKKIEKSITIAETNKDDNSDSSGCLTEIYRFAPFWNWSVTFIPRYSSFFNSFECDRLPLAPKKRYQFSEFKNLYSNIANKSYLRNLVLNKRDLMVSNFKLNKLSFNCDDDFIYYLNNIDFF